MRMESCNVMSTVFYLLYNTQSFDVHYPVIDTESKTVDLNFSVSLEHQQIAQQHFIQQFIM